MSIALTDIRPRRDRVLVRPYRRPAQIGSIIVPEQARDNITLTAWEFVRAGEGVSDAWGIELQEGDLLRTSAIGAIFIGTFDQIDHYIMHIDAIREIIPWQS